MSEDKFEIGLRDVFNEVKTLSGQVSAYMQAQAPVIAVIQHRLDEVESDINEIHGTNHEAAQHRNDERRHRASVRWMALSAIAGSVVADVLTLILHK